MKARSTVTPMKFRSVSKIFSVRTGERSKELNPFGLGWSTHLLVGETDTPSLGGLIDTIMPVTALSAAIV